MAADFVNLALMMSTVPTQWKQAYIRPGSKTPTPQQLTNYRPVSITLVLSRLTERVIVLRYIYPALSSPPPPLQFDDQFAFRPTGSTTAAIVHLLDSVINLLETELMPLSYPCTSSKLLILYGTRHYFINWLNFIFPIKFTIGWWTSLITIPTAPYSRRIVLTASHHRQGSAIGPAAYVVLAGDFVAAVPGNSMCKYADDTYIIIPASNETTRHEELTNVHRDGPCETTSS